MVCIYRINFTRVKIIWKPPLLGVYGTDGLLIYVARSYLLL